MIKVLNTNFEICHSPEIHQLFLALNLFSRFWEARLIGFNNETSFIGFEFVKQFVKGKETREGNIW